MEDMSSVEMGWVVTRQEAQWMLCSTPLHLEWLEKKAGVPHRRKGYTFREFERMSRAGRPTARHKSGVL